MSTDTKTKALEILGNYYQLWEQDSSRMTSGYAYEKSFMEMMQKVQKEILEASTGEKPKNKNLKKKYKP
jgi:hypothetical protein